jgi:hypothetical protein
MEEVGRAGARFMTYQAQSLSRPIGVGQRRINWRYAFAVGSYHLLALLAFRPWRLSRTGVALALIGVHVFGAAGDRSDLFAAAIAGSAGSGVGRPVAETLGFIGGMTPLQSVIA